jgi:hypothetical protein
MDPGDEDREIRRLIINETNRKNIRIKIIQTWLTEKPRIKYRYNVENISGKRWIYLRRPAHLNKGCDFKIYVEGWLYHKNGNEKPPRHKDILDDLKEKFKENRKEYLKLEKAITKIYNCELVEDVLKDSKNLKLKKGLDIKTLLKSIKWFFIEQDITDWNYSGREMFQKAINNIKVQYDIEEWC